MTLAELKTKLRQANNTPTDHIPIRYNGAEFNVDVELKEGSNGYYVELSDKLNREDMTEIKAEELAKRLYPDKEGSEGIRVTWLQRNAFIKGFKAAMSK